MTNPTLDLGPVAVSIDVSVGHIAELKIQDGDRTLTPLHRAAWVDDANAEFPHATAPNVKHLSGDFFCAPFGRNDLEPAPSHGWPANSEWDHIETVSQDGRASLVFRLRKRVMGARVEKRLTLVTGHPFLYQEHSFTGGAGAVSAAHHVMVHMAAGGSLAFSPKQNAQSPAEPLETDPARGRSILAYPASGSDLTVFPLADGGTADLTAYPIGLNHEDFVVLAEKRRGSAPDALGWTVVSRRAERDHVIVLKRPEVLPLTMLWMSNGGRDYAPWSGRHKGVLGIEDARASPLGHAESCRENDFTRAGIATAFDLAAERKIVIRQVVGACSAEPGEGRVLKVAADTDVLTLHFGNGRIRRLSYDSAFLAG
ncbi:hypothetical protein PZ897_00605 [Hoeflea sp. YIM 152468]|uniref:hypothetical protein n=1 Tax=Hoeflea sp. YIM 152468 TaxID=3031759 RepID=UPI0023DA9032|nr:hypothetical protein [Hoeflea sp. YIM 152468]MDF1606667.1 hypothetical protein [Hoeflea sp. YIM 152468]